MKKLLDRYISNHYDEVRAYTLYFLSKMGSNIEADTVINNSYLHVLTINEDAESEDQVKSYLLNTIKYQILWNSSLSHKHDRVNSMEYEDKDEVDDEQDLHAKILEDKIYSTHKGIIEIYRSEIVDHVHRIVFEAYIDKGYTTARAMAKYFDIPVTSAHYLIREIKQKQTQTHPTQRLSQIISILATFTALTGAVFLLRDNSTQGMRAFGVWVILYYAWLFTEQYEYDKESKE